MPTLDDCVLEVRQRTGTVGSLHVTDAEIRTVLNTSLARLHGKLTCAFEEYSLTTLVVTVTDATAKGFTLPTDFFKLLRLDKSLSNSAATNDWYRIKRINVRDESCFNANAIRFPRIPRVTGYLMLGSEIHLIPQLLVTGVYQLLYYPTWVTLVGSDTVVIGPPGQRWEEWAILQACIFVAGKEETDPSVWVGQLGQLTDELEGIIANRDAGEAEPPTMTDTPWYDRTIQGLSGWSGGWY